MRKLGVEESMGSWPAWPSQADSLTGSLGAVRGTRRTRMGIVSVFNYSVSEKNQELTRRF